MTAPLHDETSPGLGDRLDPVCKAFESEWRADRPPRLEEYLPHVEEADRPALLRELLILDLHYRGRRGERPSADEYAARLPRYAVHVRSYFASVPTGSQPPPAPGSTSATAQAPAAVPGYAFLEVLGEGGMGRVYKAHQTRLDRLVAVKVIRPDRLSDAAAVERFHKEARAAARLHHPNVVAVHDAGEHGGMHYLVLEYVPGVPLHRLLADKGPLTVSRACDYVRQAAAGLAYAHRLGLVHRDVKPSNLILGEDGVVKVADFGLARSTALEGEATALTATGDLMGTPDYIAPEQVRDPRGVDGRADVYSLGCTLFTLLAGRPPFQVVTAGQKVAAHLEREPPRLDEVRRDVPPALADVVARMMAKDRDARFAGAGEAAEALAPFVGAPARTVKPRPRRRGPWLVVGLALLLAGGIAALGVFLVQHWPYGPAAPPANTPPPGPVVQAPNDKPEPVVAPPRRPVGDAPDAPPPAGEPDFQENFDGKGTFLPRMNTGPAKQYFTSDRYVTELPAGGSVAWTTNYGPPLWDFAADVQFDLDGGDLLLTFRERANEKFKTQDILRVNAGGRVVLGRLFWSRNGNTDTQTDAKDLLDGTAEALPRDEAPRSLRVTASGEAIEVWLNGKRVAQGRDEYKPDASTVGTPYGLSMGVSRPDPFTAAKLSLARLRIWRLGGAAGKGEP